METLVEKQYRFTLAVADLINFCHEREYTITFGDAYRDPRLHGALGEKKGYGHRNSCHKLRLAVDFNLIIDGKLARPDQYGPLHDFWDLLGGAKRIEHDMNHFSFEHNGYR